MKRTQLQTRIWKVALDEDPPDMDQGRNFDWIKDDSKKSTTPVTEPSGVRPAPLEILQMIRCGNKAYSPGTCVVPNWLAPFYVTITSFWTAKTGESDVDEDE